MTNDNKINYLELPCNNFDAVQQFYETTFGWTFISYGEEYRAFNDGNMDGGFYASDQHSFTSSGAALIVIYAENLEKTQKSVVENGGTIKKQIFSFPGGRRFHFSDPCGNELAVWSEQ